MFVIVAALAISAGICFAQTYDGAIFYGPEGEVIEEVGNVQFLKDK